MKNTPETIPLAQGASLVLKIVTGCIASLVFCLPQSQGSVSDNFSENRDLVAHWPLDETSGNGAEEVIQERDGRLINFTRNSSRKWQPGKVGNALVFDGQNDYVVHDFDLPKEAGTLAHWIKPFTNKPMVAVYESTDNLSEIQTGLKNLQSQFIYQTGSDSRVSSAKNTFPIDHWTHLAVTWNRQGELVRYVNCKPVDARNLSQEEFSNRQTRDRFFGKPSQDTRFWHGALDEIKVWNRALSQKEIKSLCRSDVPYVGSGPAAKDSTGNDQLELRTDRSLHTERDPFEPTCAQFLKWRMCCLNDRCTQFRFVTPPPTILWDGKSAGVLGWTKRLLKRRLQLESARKHIVTIEEQDRRLRPSSVAIESVLEGGTVRDSTITMIDANDDGLTEGVEVEGFAFLPTLDLNPRPFDLNGNGVMDYVGLPPLNVIGKLTFIPLADTNSDGIPDSTAFDFDGDNEPDRHLLTPFLAGPPNPKVAFKLYFSQFGDGGSNGDNVSTELTLFNLDAGQTADVMINIRGENGEGLTVDLNGEEVAGKMALQIPPGEVAILSTDGVGELITGSVEVESSTPLGGVVLFGGSAGLAGVGPSPVRPEGFIGTMESNDEAGINTGIALMNLEAFQITVNLALLDSHNQPLARAALVLPGRGHRAIFLDRIQWEPEEEVELDFSAFRGVLKASSLGNLAATVIETRPGELATLPVARNLNIQETSSARQVDAVGKSLQDPDYKLYFAQFADGRNGESQLSSEILLLNLTGLDANVEISLKNDEGNPLTIDLNGELVTGQKNLVIPKGALRVLSTDGQGDLQVGSVTVFSDRMLAGTILFSGTAGVAGVGSSTLISRAFEAPIQSDAASGTDTGIAVMNLTAEIMTVDLELFDTRNARLAKAQLPALAAMGHRAIYLSAIEWQPEAGVVLNFSNFNGLLRARVSGRAAATVMRTGPGVFATQPVVSSLN